MVAQQPSATQGKADEMLDLPECQVFEARQTELSQMQCCLVRLARQRHGIVPIFAQECRKRIPHLWAVVALWRVDVHPPLESWRFLRQKNDRLLSVHGRNDTVHVGLPRAERQQGLHHRLRLPSFAKPALDMTLHWLNPIAVEALEAHGQHIVDDRSSFFCHFRRQRATSENAQELLQVRRQWPAQKRLCLCRRWWRWLRWRWWGHFNLPGPLPARNLTRGIRPRLFLSARLTVALGESVPIT
mmetsp:Transcript_46921/g.124696  ORF Transcript_46921/g.124696 Transcript_46921/m.124696 type:complete len:243 (+) Transcript_46921:901-1629(+)